jgi:WD40 repeat protein
MLDFLDGLKKKTSEDKPAPAKKAEPKKAVAGTPAEAGVAAPSPAATARLDEAPAPIKLPRILKKKGPGTDIVIREPKKAEPKDAKEAREKRKPPVRPRPIKTRRSGGWRPVLFKLLVGVGVASGAVAIQDRLPHYESQGAGETSSAIRTASLQEAPVIRPIAELSGHVGAVTAVAFASDGSAIATVGADARLKIWNPDAGTLTRTIELDNGPATALALFGDRALTGHATGEIVLWDWQKADKIAFFKRNEAEIWSLAFAGRADRFAASSHDWKVTLWDTATPGGPVQVIDAHDSAAQAVAYASTPRGPVLASGGADKTVKLWNLDTLDRMRTYRGHRDFITALSFSPDGKILASASLDGSIRLWSTSSNRLLRRLYGHRGRVGGLSFSPDGTSLASSGADGQLRIWDVARGRTVHTITGHAGAINGVSYSPDGERIASAGDDGIVRLWANPIPRAPATN